MSMETISDEKPVDPDDELLVAYLDGELDNQSRASVEQRLMDDEALRVRLQSLQRSWDWLNELPELEPSEKLVESTMELVVADFTEPERKRSSAPLARLRGPLLIGLASLVAAAVTWSGISASREQAYRSQLRDLEIAENLDAYLSGRNLNLMRELAMNPAWEEMVASARAVGYLRVDSVTSIADVPQNDREKAIAEMPIESRTQLASRWDRFTRLDDLQQVRQTAAKLAVQTDQETLLKTMRIYAVWRDSLSPELRTQIESDQISERKMAIDTAIEFTMKDVTRRSGNILPQGAEEPILWVLRKIADQRIAKLSGPGKDFFLQRSAGLSQDEKRYNVIRVILFRDDPRFDRFRRGGPQLGGPQLGGPQLGGPQLGGPQPRGPQLGGPQPGGQNPGRLTTIAPITDEELSMIKPILESYDLESEFYELTFGDPQYELMVLRAWAEEALRRTVQNDEEQMSMLERYMHFDPSARSNLDLKPPKEILHELATPSEPLRGPPGAFGGGPRPGLGPGR